MTDKLVRLGIVSVMGVLLLVTCTPPRFNGDEADNKAQAVVPHAGNDGEPQSQEPAQPETPRQKVGLAIFAVPEPTSPGSQTDDGDVSSVIAPPDWALGRWAGIIVGRVDPTALYLVFTKHDMTFNLVVYNSL